MKRFRIIALSVGAVLWVLGVHAHSFAQTNNSKINNSKVGQDMRDVKVDAPGTFDGSARRTTGGQGTAVQGHSGQKESLVGQSSTVIHPPASKSMKSVDTAKVPAPATPAKSPQVTPAKAPTQAAPAKPPATVAPVKAAPPATAVKAAPPPPVRAASPPPPAKASPPTAHK
jgi:hypothetical protein